MSRLLFLLLFVSFVTNHAISQNIKVVSAELSLAGGQIQRIQKFPSEFVTPRNIDIWLPENYTKTKSYAVLYMHDGKMLFDPSDTWNSQEWGVDEAMVALTAKGLIRDAIVVGIWNVPEQRHADYFPQKAFEFLSESDQRKVLDDAGKSNLSISMKFSADNYLKFLVNELKPFIDSNYSTLKDRKNTFLAGSSMGGLISMYAVTEYPMVFGGAACLSTHWPGVAPADNNPVPEAIFKYIEANFPNASDHKMYFDYGTETLDAYYPQYASLLDSIFVLKGYGQENYLNLKFEGDAHDENSWRNRIEVPLTFLLSRSHE